MHSEFSAKDVVVFGISLDGAGSHQRFRERDSLPFDLLVDQETRLSRLYDVKVTNLLIVKLVERVTYVIGKDGRIQRAFKSVKPQGHAAQVLESMGQW